MLDAAALRRLAARARPDRRLVAADLALPRDLEPRDDPRLDVLDLELRARAGENRQKRAAAAAGAEL